MDLQARKKSGKEHYSGKQLYKWIFKLGVNDFSAMTDLERFPGTSGSGRRG
jgi:adenine C2-methylase RlmN of 23S rRNA A2503 and tRNA A37